MAYVKNKQIKDMIGTKVILTKKKDSIAGYFEIGSTVTISGVTIERGYSFSDEDGNEVIEAGWDGFDVLIELIAEQKNLVGKKVCLTEDKPYFGGYIAGGSVVTITDVTPYSGFSFTDCNGNTADEAGFDGFVIVATPIVEQQRCE